MSINTPPNPNVSTFNNLYWISADSSLTQGQADLRYLKFPVAQGTENLQTTNVNGVFTANSTSTFNAATTFNAAIDMNNNNINDVNQLNFYNAGVPTTQVTAYTGGVAGAYTNTNMTIDANGRITAIASGTAPVNLLPLNNTWTGTNDFQNTTTMDKSLTMSGALNTDRIINGVYYQFQDSSSLATFTGQIYAGSGVINYDNDANGGSHNFATNTAVGVQTIPLNFNSVDMSIATTNPPTCSAVQPASNDSSTKMPTTAWVQTAVSGSSILATNNTFTGTNAFNNIAPITSTATQPASNDSSTKIPTTAWVQSAISAIPSSNTTTTIVVQPTNSTPVNVSIPTNCIKFDIAVYGSGGLSTPAIYYPAPNPSSTAYTIQCGAGGGGGFAKIAGIYQPRQVTQNVNTLTITMTLGNGNFTLVNYNGTNLAQVYNGTTTTATFLAGGAGCSTPPVVNSTYGSWFSSNGTQGQSGADRGLNNTPLNLQGGQNIAGGALVNTQMGVGQSYAAYSSSLATWSASPIGYGGAVITFYA